MLRIIIRRKINIHSRTPFILLWNRLAMSKFQFYFQRKFLNDRVFNPRKLVQELYILCKTSCWWIFRQTAKTERLFKSLIWIFGHTSEFNSQTQKSERGRKGNYYSIYESSSHLNGCSLKNSSFTIKIYENHFLQRNNPSTGGKRSIPRWLSFDDHMKEFHSWTPKF